MSVTVVNDWLFLENADLKQGMEAIREYLDYLRKEESELEQSLWLECHENPRRFFHIATFKSLDALERQRQSKGTLRFVDRISALIDESSVKQPTGNVVASAGRGPGDL